MLVSFILSLKPFVQDSTTITKRITISQLKLSKASKGNQCNSSYIFHSSCFLLSSFLLLICGLFLGGVGVVARDLTD